jgi:Fe-S cluster biosynthesis and repair protein YggX
MLINENRLNLADPKARKYLLEQTEQYFFGGEVDRPAGYVPPRS